MGLLAVVPLSFAVALLAGLRRSIRSEHPMVFLAIVAYKGVSGSTVQLAGLFFR